MRLRGLLSILALPALAACADDRGGESTVPTGGTIVISAAADADALLPPLSVQTTGRQMIDQIFDRLAEMRDSMNFVGDREFRGALAESWSWAPDSLSIAFRLRPEARWHDGARVTAEDVSFTYALYKRPELASPVAPLISNVDSVTARDSATAVVWFARRTPMQFYDATHNVHILPKHLLDTVATRRLRESSFAQRPVGSGRFRFSRRTPASLTEIVADTGNYRGRPRIDRVLWTVAADFNTAATRFFSGEADVFEFLRPEQIAEIGRRDDLRALLYGSLDYAFVQFNMRDPAIRTRAHPLFGDAALRTALSMAIDRAAIVRNVFDTLAYPAFGPTARGLALADTAVRQIPFDTARAARLLDSLGWRDSNGDGVRERGRRRLAFTILVPSSSRNRVRMAVLLQEQLRRVGAAAGVEQLEYGAFTERGRQRRFDAMFGAWHIEGPAGIRQTWGTAGSRSPNGLNYGSYENPRFDEAIDSALASHDVGRAREHYRRAIQIAVDDAPAIWMYEPRATLGIHRRLRPARVRADAWWAGLADWSVDPSARLPRDQLGLDTARR